MRTKWSPVAVFCIQAICPKVAIFALTAVLLLSPRLGFSDGGSEGVPNAEASAKTKQAIWARLQQLEAHTFPRDAESIDEIQSINLADASLKHGDLKMLGALPKLRHLFMDDVTIPDRNLKPLTRLGRLERLSLRGVTLRENDLKHIATLKRLEHLNLDRTPVSDKGILRLVRLPKLRGLGLADTNITSKGLKHISTFDDLRRLVLDDTGVGDEGIKHLANAPQLRELVLDNTEVGDEGIKHLANVPQLQELSLRRTGISDAGLELLSKCEKLQEVDLSHTDVSIKGVKHLNNLKSLQRIDLTGTAVVESDLKHLRRATLRQAVRPFSGEVKELWFYDGRLRTGDWQQSEHGDLALRLLVPIALAQPPKQFTLFAELKNRTDRKLLVLRPLADAPRVRSKLLTISGPDGKARYVGPIPTYGLGSNAFTVVNPGKIIRSKITLQARHWDNFGEPGQYSFQLRYKLNDQISGTSAYRVVKTAWPDKQLWTGSIKSPPVTFAWKKRAQTDAPASDAVYHITTGGWVVLILSLVLVALLLSWCIYTTTRRCRRRFKGWGGIWSFTTTSGLTRASMAGRRRRCMAWRARPGRRRTDTAWRASEAYRCCGVARPPGSL